MRGVSLWPRGWVVVFLALGLSACGDEAGTAGSGAGGSKASGAKGLLGIAAGKIVYQMEGREEGTLTAWFQNHGADVVVHQETNPPFGGNVKFIWHGGRSIRYGYDKQERYDSRLRIKITELDWNARVRREDLPKAGYENLGTETIAGLACEVWERKDPSLYVKAWVHQHLLVKEITSVGGKHQYTKTATSFEALDAIPAEALEVPAK